MQISSIIVNYSAHQTDVVISVESQIIRLNLQRKHIVRIWRYRYNHSRRYGPGKLFCDSVVARRILLECVWNGDCFPRSHQMVSLGARIRRQINPLNNAINNYGGYADYERLLARVQSLSHHHGPRANVRVMCRIYNQNHCIWVESHKGAW